jgi:hypothetical protein
MKDQNEKLLSQDYNLELLVLREKFLGGGAKSEVPPVGYYYDDKKNSTIKIKKRPIEL